MIPRAGDRIELMDMPEDPDPIEAGATGTVRRVQPLDFLGCIQIDVEWDNGRSLLLCSPPDRYRIIERSVDGQSVHREAMQRKR